MHSIQSRCVIGPGEKKKKKFAGASVHPGNFTGWVSVGIKMLFCAAWLCGNYHQL